MVVKGGWPVDHSRSGYPARTQSHSAAITSVASVTGTPTAAC